MLRRAQHERRDSLITALFPNFFQGFGQVKEEVTGIILCFIKP
jgi:hypothetical protein